MGKLLQATVLLALLAAPAGAIGGYGLVQEIGSDADAIPVLYTGGTPYEMGYWHGALMQEDVQANVAYVLEVVSSDVPGGREYIQDAWDAMEPFVSEELMAEMQGLADGAEMEVNDIHLVQAVADIAEWHCSMFNACGPATANGHMIQMRNLDFVQFLLVQDHPLIIVTEPANGHRYVNITFAGLMGCIAGLSEVGIGVSEKGDSFDYLNDTFAAKPFPFVLRDVIAKAKTFYEAVSLIRDVPRTCSYWYMVGAAGSNQAALLRTGQATFDYWVAGTQPPIPYTPPIPNVTYIGMDQAQLYNDLSAAWGLLTPEIAIEISRQASWYETNLMDAIYDLTTGEVWVAYAEGYQNACERDYVYLNPWELATPPYVVEVTPPAEATESPDSVISIRFSQAMEVATLNPITIQVTGETIGPVTGALAYQSDTNTLTFNPGVGLPLDRYLVRVVGGADGVKATSGEGMQDDYSWSFTIWEDLAAPEVEVTAPAAGATVKGVVQLAATVTDPDQGTVVRVEFLVDGKVVGVDCAAPYQASWDTRPLAVAEGPHVISAQAYDAAGHLGVSAEVAVVVDNTTFDDVPKSSRYWKYVEAVAREGIAAGCSFRPRLFCPGSVLSRGHLAVFVIRAMGVAPYYKDVPTFADVPKSSVFYPYVEALFRARITVGCGRYITSYCPNDAVSRALAAMFLGKGARIPQAFPVTPTFADVPATTAYYSWVEGLYARGVTRGCATNPLRYCPLATVTRGEIAELLCKAFGIPTN